MEEIFNLIDKKEYAEAKNKIHQLLKQEIHNTNNNHLNDV